MRLLAKRLLATLRARVYLLVALALVPAVWGAAWFLQMGESRAIEYAYAESRAMGHATGNLVELTLAQRRRLLQSAAQQNHMQALDSQRCATYLAQIQKLDLLESPLLLLAPDGQMVCGSGQAHMTQAAVAVAPWFLQARDSPVSLVSNAWQEPASGRWKMVLTQPVTNARGQVIAVLALPLDLDSWKDIVFQDMPAGALVIVVDQDGHVLMRSSGHRERVGKPVPDRFVLPFKNQTQGVLDEIGVDGVHRLYAMEVLPTTGWQVWAALPKDSVLAPYHRQLRNSLLSILPLAGLLFGLTWWLLRFTLAPVQALASVASAAAGGSLNTRAALDGPDEIRVVALELNRLLDATAQSQSALQDTLALNLSVLNGLDSHVALLDEAGVIVMVNQAWQDYAVSQQATWLVDHAVGLNYLGVFDQAAPDADAVVTARGIRAVLSGACDHFEHQYKCHPPQEERWFQLNCSRIEGKVGRAVVAHLDITAIRKMEEQVRQLAYFDALTSLPNRRLLMDRLGQTLASSQRSGLWCALMFMDLDNFKPLNDLHGHAAGDQLLQEVSARLSGCVRHVDTVARFGGDEFVVLVSDLSRHPAECAAQAFTVAEKIRLCLAQPYDLQLPAPITGSSPNEVATLTADELAGPVQHHCTATLGVVVFGPGDSNLNTILKHADAAMYQAKAAGRNGIQFYQPQPNAKFLH